MPSQLCQPTQADIKSTFDEPIKGFINRAIRRVLRISIIPRIIESIKARIKTIAQKDNTKSVPGIFPRTKNLMMNAGIIKQYNLLENQSISGYCLRFRNFMSSHCRRCLFNKNSVVDIANRIIEMACQRLLSTLIFMYVPAAIKQITTMSQLHCTKLFFGKTRSLNDSLRFRT